MVQCWESESSQLADPRSRRALPLALVHALVKRTRSVVNADHGSELTTTCHLGSQLAHACLTAVHAHTDCEKVLNVHAACGAWQIGGGAVYSSGALSISGSSFTFCNASAGVSARTLRCFSELRSHQHG